MNKHFQVNGYQAPAVSVTILGVTFGLHDISQDEIDITKEYIRPATPKSLAEYPNLITQLKVNKVVNGEVNKYEITMKYLPQDGEDPNYIEKLISANRTQNGSRIIISYGDASLYGNNTRQWEAIILKYRMRADFNIGCMTYIIECMSTARMFSLAGPAGEPMQNSFDPVSGERCSDVIKRIYYDPTYGLQLVFPGGIYIDDVHISEWDNIDPPDIVLEESSIPGGKMTSFEYLKLLTSRMISSDIGTNDNPTSFMYSIDDSLNNQSFRINRLINSEDIADEIVIGTEGSVVIDYEVTTDMSYGIALDYGEELSSDTFTNYFVNASGEEESVESVGAVTSSDTDLAAVDLKWWEAVSSYPYGLKLITRAMRTQLPLMSRLRITILIKGMVHNMSGIFMLVKCDDEVNSDGYTTTMELIRVEGVDQG